MINFPDSLVETIKKGNLAVIPTDTIYGIVAEARNKQAIENLRSVKKRGLDKAFIVLVSSADEIQEFLENTTVLGFANSYWPGTSVVLETNGDYGYLSGDLDGVAFRVPDDKELINLLDKTGPLAAPSANPDSLPPAETINQAKAYFGDEVATYVDYGTLNGAPSRLVKLSRNGSVTVLRA